MDETWVRIEVMFHGFQHALEVDVEVKGIRKWNPETEVVFEDNLHTTNFAHISSLAGAPYLYDLDKEVDPLFSLFSSTFPNFRIRLAHLCYLSPSYILLQFKCWKYFVVDGYRTIMIPDNM